MKIYKPIFAILVLSSAVLTSIIFQQNASADDEGNMTCAKLAGCKPSADCNSPGTQKPNCQIMCANGGWISCGEIVLD